MAHSSTLQAILQLCEQLDRKALAIYQEFARDETSTHLRQLWRAMAQDEREHTHLWGRLRQMVAQDRHGLELEDEEAALASLQQLPEKIERLLGRYRDKPGSSTAFLVALGLEHYLFHITFLDLFSYLQHHSMPGESPNYRQHLQRLLTAVETFEDLNPEIEILGETVSQIWSLWEKSTQEAVTDPLTQLLNRRGLALASRPLLFWAIRNNAPLGVLMIDIDDFKQINDRFGHTVGDQVLQRICAGLRHRLRSSDILCRYGGEELVALLTHIDSGSLAELASTLCTDMAASDMGDLGLTQTVTLSIGGCSEVPAPPPEIWLGTAIHAADQAMYHAKTSGKNKAVVTHGPLLHHPPAAPRGD